VDEVQIKFLADVVEQALNEYLPFTEDAYRKQAMNLVFNLKKNDVSSILRFAVFLSRSLTSSLTLVSKHHRH
jgi:hypothetical protein